MTNVSLCNMHPEPKNTIHLGDLESVSDPSNNVHKNEMDI